MHHSSSHCPLGVSWYRFPSIRILPHDQCLSNPSLSKLCYWTLRSPILMMYLDSQADAKAVRLISILIVLLHAALALCFKVLFFSYYAVKPIGPADPIPDPIS